MYKKFILLLFILFIGCSKSKSGVSKEESTSIERLMKSMTNISSDYGYIVSIPKESIRPCHGYICSYTFKARGSFIQVTVSSEMKNVSEKMVEERIKSFQFNEITKNIKRKNGFLIYYSKGLSNKRYFIYAVAVGKSKNSRVIVEYKPKNIDLSEKIALSLKPND